MNKKMTNIRNKTNKTLTKMKMKTHIKLKQAI